MNFEIKIRFKLLCARCVRLSEARSRLKPEFACESSKSTLKVLESIRLVRYFFIYTLGIFSGAGATYHNHCLGTPRRPELHPPQCTILATLSHTASRALMRTTVLVCGGPAMSPFWSFFGFGVESLHLLSSLLPGVALRGDVIFCSPSLLTSRFCSLKKGVVE